MREADQERQGAADRVCQTGSAGHQARCVPQAFRRVARIEAAVLVVLACGAAEASPVPEALRSTTFVAFDVETTGLSAARHRIIEIGAVKFRAGQTVARKAWLVNPGQPIPPATTRIHGLTDADDCEAPGFAQVCPEFMAFVKDTMLVAHNAGFDIRFIAHETHRNRVPFPPEPILDSLRLVRKWYPDLKHHGLESVAGHLGIDPGRHHRARDDAQTLAEVFTCGLRNLPADTTLSNLVEAAGNALYIEAAVPLDSATTETAR